VGFEGQWATSFGQMNLRRDGARVTGTYGRDGTENTIDGTVEAGQFTFRYEEAHERGSGWFRLRRPGCFSGEYVAERNSRPLPWQGWRGFDGLWDTSLGRLRLVQEAGRVWGSSELDTSVRLQGDLEPGGRLAFRLEGAQGKGGGHFDLESLGYLLEGEWAEDGNPAGAIRGQRAMPRPGLTWLVVLEAQRQRALDGNEFSIGQTLRDLFARLPWAVVRHRFYDDEASLLRWSRQLLYLPEPAILVVPGYGEAGGESRGRAAGAANVGLASLVESLRFADGLKLLHLSSAGSLAGPDTARALREAPFPVSGYTGDVDWAQTALADLVYLDMILDRGLAPDKAAQQLPRIVSFAGNESLPGSPYRPAGFTLITPDARFAEASLDLQTAPMSRSKLH
jgi:hypothetical protein